MKQKKIIHIDMDAFFASVEQRDFPEYRGKPVIVGGNPEKRGVVAACSYEARKYGIHSAMSAAQAYRRCPNAIFIRPRFEVYRQVSKEIRSIFELYTELVEPLSLDEAYLDVTDCTMHQGSATLIAKDIKSAIYRQTSLTASAGISYNKFLAKLASDMDKPNGIYVIKPSDAEKFIEKLPIGKFFGIGRATEAKMQTLGIHNGTDLKEWSREDLASKFGKLGSYYYNIVRGIDSRNVISNRQRKSLGSETTFESDIDDISFMLDHLYTISRKIFTSMKAQHLLARTITLKVKYADFKQVTRSVTLNEPVKTVADINNVLPGLLSKTQAGVSKVRLLGIALSKFEILNEIEKEQLGLFE